MSTETELRDAFAEVGSQAPDAGPIFDRIVAGSRARRRKRRIGYVAGVCAAVVAIAAPGSLWLLRSSPTRPVQQSGIATIPIAPTWLPDRFVETGREYGPNGFAGRTFGHGNAWISIVDGATRDDSWDKGTAVTVDGRRGVLSGSKANIAAELQVPWRSGRLLEIQVEQVHDARSAAIRVARSLRTAPAVTVDAPLTCGDPMCRGHDIDVGGARTKWEASVVGRQAHASLTYGYGGPPSDVDRQQNITINGRPAVLWESGMDGAGVYIDLGGHRSIMVASQMRHGLTSDEAIRIAKSVHLARTPDYDWLGTRP